MASSIAAAVAGCIFSGSSPSTKIGAQPLPSKYFVNSSSLLRERIVGLEILKPFKFKIGKTAPSFLGLINVLDNHDAANGPVSASPSPTTTAAMTSGLSKIAPTPCDNE